MKKNKVMTHIVAGYPDYKTCIELLIDMQRAGVHAIEIQIPFTDPIADGVAIMEANDTAVENDTNTEVVFQLIKEVREKGLTTPLYLMSYVNKLYVYGIEKFVQKAQDCSIAGLILPDIGRKTPEEIKIKDLCDKAGIAFVPVLSPGLRKEETPQASQHDTFAYLTSSKGITGNRLSIRQSTVEATHLLRNSGYEVLLGFGIQTPEDVRKALEIANVAVVGSEITRRIKSGSREELYEYIGSLTG